MSSRPDAKEDLDRAMISYNMASEGLCCFQAACAAGDWEAAERHRENLLSAYESFMDNYAAAFRA